MVKKYGIFISSTFNEMHDEREATINAIWDCGHIPIGMETFRPGKLKWDTITKAIDEADIYLLILGGRYGDIEKGEEYSYIEREYRYAESKNMPVMTLYLDNTYLSKKYFSCNDKEIFEVENINKYNLFKNYVKKRIFRQVNDIRDISSNMPIIIGAAEKEGNLRGWIREEFGMRYFKNTDETDPYIAKRIKEAKLSVKDFTWRDNYQNPKLRHETLRKKFQNDFEEAIANINDNIEYIEIFTFLQNREERYEKMKALMIKSNYYCGFYKSDNNFPKMHFVIIDDKEVIFVSGQYEGFLCATTNKNIVGIMLAYYNEAWNLSIKVKDMHKTFEDNLKLAEKIAYAEEG